MVSMPVSLQAELLIAQMLRKSAGSALCSQTEVTHIELFCHALEPGNVLFGTAWVNGQMTALGEPILAALRALELTPTPSTLSAGAQDSAGQLRRPTARRRRLKSFA